jgi:uncharacterized protein
MKVMITGGSGLVGSKLTKMLTNKGVEVVWLSRKAGVKAGINAYAWDYTKNYIDSNAFYGVTHIVHLAGAGVFDKRWSQTYKKELYESRVNATKLLVRTVAQYPAIKTCVCASAIGIYGNSLDTAFLAEDAPVGTDFLATLTNDWELANEGFNEINIRTVKFRTGIVLAKEGGALPAITAPIRAYMGSPLASGKQIVSWIHIDDLCNMFVHALEDDTMKGVYNAVAPNPVSNKELTEQVAHILNKPMFLPHVPAFILKIVLGTKKSFSVTEGIAVSALKVQQQGFVFKFDTIHKALLHLLKSEPQ